MDSLFEQLMKTYTVHQITDLIKYLQSQYRVTWKPVGGRENNFPNIHIGTDPAAALIERITNAIDAVLEREWIVRGKPRHVRTPRQAVEEWFDIKGGTLESLSLTSNAQNLSYKVIVTLFDSERADRSTVDIRDYGLGIRSEDFSSTIVSLNESNKVDKLFLAGAYGQGGSTALAYSEYALVVSRAIDENGSSTPAAFTVIRWNEGNLETEKHGKYEYLINHATGNPFTIENVSDKAFPPGTLVRHIAMDLGKYNAIMTAPTNSLWYLAHHYLFDPVLPFRIEERRTNSSRGQNRTVMGNRYRLRYGEHTEYFREATQTFRSGSVTIRWWVLSAEGENTKRRITNYTLASQPIIITYNGQKQGYLPNTIIKNDLKLPYLDRFIVVQVDCDSLDPDSRRQLFATTREAIRYTSLRDEIRQLVTETLQADPELVRLDRERKQRYIQRVESAALENLRRRLANRIQTFMSTGRRGSSPNVPSSGTGGMQEEAPPVPVLNPPTLLQITSPNPRKVYSGKRFYLHFRTDADPSYFLNPDVFLAIITPSSFGQYTGTINVRNGYGVAYFKVNENIEPGKTAEITLELRPPRSKALSDSITVEVVPLPYQAGGEEGQARIPNINVQWVSRGDDFWEDHSWDVNSVVAVQEQDDSIDVFVSRDNRTLNTLIARAQRKGNAVVDATFDYYLEHIAFHAILANLRAQKSETTEENESSDAGFLERERQREMQRVCETVCGILNQMFDLIATEAAATSEEETQ